MNQEKIGDFIAQCRKEKGYTQSDLAEYIGISNRAVSKWETGKSLPDASIMLELCNLLNINVNELLTGERISMDNYKEMAEKNLVELKRQEEDKNKRLLALENVIGYVSSISFLVLVFTASFAAMEMIWRILIIFIAFAIFIVGAYNAVKIEHDAGYYECPNCGNRYTPTMKAVFFATHIWRNRKMTCPHCHKRGYHKKVLTK